MGSLFVLVSPCFRENVVVKGHFTCKSMEIGIIEGTNRNTFKHYKAHFDLKQKLPIYFFMKFAQFEEWKIWYIL